MFEVRAGDDGPWFLFRVIRGNRRLIGSFVSRIDAEFARHCFTQRETGNLPSLFAPDAADYSAGGIGAASNSNQKSTDDAQIDVHSPSATNSRR